MEREMSIQASIKALGNIQADIIKNTRSVQELEESLENWTPLTVDEINKPGRKRTKPDIKDINDLHASIERDCSRLNHLQDAAGIPYTNDKEISHIVAHQRAQNEGGRPSKCDLENFRKDLYKNLIEKASYISLHGFDLESLGGHAKRKLNGLNKRIKELSDLICKETGSEYNQDTLLSNEFWYWYGKGEVDGAPVTSNASTTDETSVEETTSDESIEDTKANEMNDMASSSLFRNLKKDFKSTDEKNEFHKNSLEEVFNLEEKTPPKSITPSIFERNQEETSANSNDELTAKETLEEEVESPTIEAVEETVDEAVEETVEEAVEETVESKVEETDLSIEELKKMLSDMKSKYEKAKEAADFYSKCYSLIKKEHQDTRKRLEEAEAMLETSFKVSSF